MPPLQIYEWQMIRKIAHQTRNQHTTAPLNQISVDLENIRFWDQISPKNMTDKTFEKINIKIVIST